MDLRSKLGRKREECTLERVETEKLLLQEDFVLGEVPFLSEH